MPRRQMIGFLVLAFLLTAGHVLRVHLLVGPGDSWRKELQTLPWTHPDSTREDSPPTPKATLVVPLGINTAPLDSLVLLPGVGPVLASRIIATRSTGQMFKKAADLKAVKGIGPQLAAKLDTLLTYRTPPRQ